MQARPLLLLLESCSSRAFSSRYNDKVMRYFLLFSFLIILLPVFAEGKPEKKYYSFSTEMETEVVKYDGKEIELKVISVDREDEAEYGPGSIIYGNIINTREAKRFFRDEKITIHVHAAKVGQYYKAQNLMLKLKPRGLFAPRFTGNRIISATSLPLSLAIDGVSVGLPVSRGGLAIWGAISEMHERELGESRLKTGSLGFVKGAIYPLDRIFLKGKAMDIKLGDRITIDKEKHGTNVDALLRPARETI